MISIVNYGMGNIGSVINMFKRVGVLTEVISTVSEIEKAEKILLPGVGSFDAAMTKIQELGIREALDHKALNDKIPILGICLGMQLLTRGSEEGSLKGFGWVDAQTKSFKKAIDTKKYKVPHMGWNRVSIAKTNPLTHGLEDSSETRFYFVHSYYIECLQT
jgi:imidazole glycerol-phosphate synthase subunit HisH